jgi:hypothetical protein
MRRRGFTTAEIARRVNLTRQGVEYVLGLHCIQASRTIRCRRCKDVIVATKHRDQLSGPVLCLECLGAQSDATFGQRLKAFRLAAGLSKRALSAQTGIPRHNLSKYEADEWVPLQKSMSRLVQILGAPLDDSPRRKLAASRRVTAPANGALTRRRPTPDN